MEQQKKRKGPLLRWLGIGLLAAVLAVCLAFGLLQTPMIKQQVSTRGSALLSSGPDQRVQLGRLEGFVPFSMRMDAIQLSDAQGPWLKLENLVIRWSPLALLRGAVVVDEISASALNIARLPQPPQAAEQPKETAPFQLPATLPPVEVEKLAISDLSLAAQALGHSGSFALHGSLVRAETGAGLKASLQLARTDPGPRTGLDLAVELHTSPAELRVELGFEEAAGGWAASVAGLQDAGPLKVSLRGDGPLDAWHGELAADAGRYGSIEALLDLAAGDEMKLAIDGRYALGELVASPQLQLVLGSTVRFDFLGRLRPSRTASIDKAIIEGVDYGAHITGGFDFEQQQLKTDFRFDVNNLSRLESLTAGPLKGSFALWGSFAGPVSEPQGSLSVELREVEMQGYRAGSVQTVLQVQPLGPVSAEFPGVRIAGEGSARQLASVEGKPLPEEDLRWTLDGKVQARKEISIAAFELSGKHLQAKLAGRYDLSDMTGALDAELRADDLKPLSQFAGEPLAGAAAIEAHLRGDGRSRSASGEVKALVQPAQGLSPVAAALCGEKATGHVQFELRAGSLLEVPDLRLESSVFALKAHSSVDMSAAEVRAGWQLSVPQLAPLAPVAGKPLAGSLQAKGEVAGPLKAFAASATVEGSKVVFDRIELQKLLLTADARRLPEAPEGTLAVTLSKQDAAIRASAGFSLHGRELALNPVALDAPGTELKGELAGSLEKNLFKGHLNGKMTDLASLGRFVEQPMAGSGTLRVQFSVGKQGQDMKLAVAGKGLSTPAAAVQAVNLSADLQNVLSAPAGSLNLQIQALKSADLKLDELHLKASGDGRDMQFQGTARGRSIRPFRCQTRGTVTLSGKARQVRLEQLDGNLDQYTIRLLQPLALQFSEGRYALDALAVGVGKGKVRGSGRLDPGQVKLDAGFEGIPLELAALFNGPSVSGSAEGRLHLAGPPSSPEAKADLQLKNVRLADAALKDLPPIGLSAAASLRQGALSVKADLQGLTEKPARADFTVPAGFSLQPFAVSLPGDGRLAGHLDLEADLARLTRLVPLDGQVLSGTVAASLALDGPVDAPRLDGSVILKNGSYENFTSGTVLKNWNVTMVAAGQRLNIDHFQASDGQQGTVAAKGFVDVDADKDFPLHLELGLTDATLVRRSDVTGTVGGKLAVAGSLADIRVNGNLQVSPVEVDLPERLPPEMTQLQVVEIHGGADDRPAEHMHENQTASPVRLALDIGVTLPRRVFVRGWGLDSEWQGKLNITGTADRPVIVGSLSAVRGKVDFLNKQFDIKSGTITFYGGSPPVPTLDLTAESTVKDMTARIVFSGVATDPKMTLTSEPSLPSDEILAKLLFGRSATAITPSQALQLAMVARSLAGGRRGDLDFMSRTRRLLGLDELEFNSSEEGMTKGTVGIGKYLAEGVYLNVQKGVGQGADKAGLEVELTPNITVESQVGSDSTSGIGVNWKYDY